MSPKVASFTTRYQSILKSFDPGEKLATSKMPLHLERISWNSVKAPLLPLLDLTHQPNSLNLVSRAVEPHR